MILRRAITPPAAAAALAALAAAATLTAAAAAAAAAGGGGIALGVHKPPRACLVVDVYAKVEELIGDTVGLVVTTDRFGDAARSHKALDATNLPHPGSGYPRQKLPQAPMIARSAQSA